MKRGSSEYTRVALSFLAAGIATFAMLYDTQPLFPIFSNQFHISPAVSSLSLSLTTIFLAISLPIAGAISDAYGRKKIMLVSVLASLISCGLTVFSPNFTALLVLRSVQGIALAGLPATAMAYLSEEVERGSLGFAMGLYIAGNTIGGLSGRLVVSFIVDVASWRWAIGGIAIISLLMGLYFWRNLPNSKHFSPKATGVRALRRSLGDPFRDIGLVYLFLIGGLLMLGFVTLYNFMGFRLLQAPYHFSQSLVGLIFLVYLAGTFSSSFMGRVADHVGRRKVLWLNIFIMATGASVTLAHNILWIILGTILFTFGFFGGHSTASSWVGNRAKSGKGQASALYLLFYYVGSSLAGPFGGLLWSYRAWNGVVVLILAAVGLSFVISIVLAMTATAQVNAVKTPQVRG